MKEGLSAGTFVKNLDFKAPTHPEPAIQATWDKTILEAK